MLKVKIFKDGKHVKTREFNDPRTAYVREFNSVNETSYAVPVQTEEEMLMKKVHGLKLAATVSLFVFGAVILFAAMTISLW